MVCYVAFVDLIAAGYAGLCVGCFGWCWDGFVWWL